VVPAAAVVVVVVAVAEEHSRRAVDSQQSASSRRVLSRSIGLSHCPLRSGKSMLSSRTVPSWRYWSL